MKDGRPVLNRALLVRAMRWAWPGALAGFAVALCLLFSATVPAGSVRAVTAPLPLTGAVLAGGARILAARRWHDDRGQG